MILLKLNTIKEELYCTECKNLIQLGEKYIETIEEVLEEEVQKEYHLDCAPVENSEEDEPFLHYDTKEELDF